jgi:hypothetical protein
VSQTSFIWIVILAACVAANLPFLNHRILALGPMRAPSKALWVRLLELLLFYFAVGGLALVLEGRVGQVAPQGWEFYAVTAALFLTLAFPGFVYQYLLRRR